MRVGRSKCSSRGVVRAAGGALWLDAAQMRFLPETYPVSKSFASLSLASGVVMKTRVLPRLMT